MNCYCFMAGMIHVVCNIEVNCVLDVVTRRSYEVQRIEFHAFSSCCCPSHTSTLEANFKVQFLTSCHWYEILNSVFSQLAHFFNENDFLRTPPSNFKNETHSVVGRSKNFANKRGFFVLM